MSVHPCSSPVRLARTVVTALTVLAIAGCASTRIDAQQTDPQFQGRSLRGARLLVVCEAPDATLKRLCQEQLAGELTALGASPTVAPEIDNPRPGREQPTSAYLPAARAAHAQAVFSAAVAPDPDRARSGPSIGIGIGGFGGGGHVGVGGGLGISLPIGGAGATTGQVMNGALTDVASGRLMWSANASTPAASSAAEQLGALARTITGAAQQAGFF